MLPASSLKSESGPDGSHLPASVSYTHLDVYKRQDVATISMIVAKQQELSPEEVREIGVCGLLHDIGKTKIPNAILNLSLIHI